MIEIAYNQTDFEELLKHIARLLKVKVHDNAIEIPAEMGKGFVRVINLANNLQVLISSYTFNTDVLFRRNKINKEYYSFRFDEMILPESGTPSPKSAVFLSNTKYDWLFLHPANVQLKSAAVNFSKDWLDRFLGNDGSTEDIKKYVLLKLSPSTYDPLDAEYRRLLNELMNGMSDKRFELFVVHNRLMLLLERFFTRISAKMNDAHFSIKISAEDIARLKVTEAELIKDFSLEPPSINKLARLAMMSPTKLKAAFKEIYGLPLYQYYQKQRMNKAKAMLISRKYTVKDVGLELGYTNMSNFAKAFSKSFDQLPSEVAGKQN